MESNQRVSFRDNNQDLTGVVVDKISMAIPIKKKKVSDYDEDQYDTATVTGYLVVVEQDENNVRINKKQDIRTVPYFQIREWL